MESGRRAYDNGEVDSAVKVYVQQELTDTRHLLRNEFTLAMAGFTKQIAELHAVVMQGNLQSTREHAEVRGELREIRAEMGVLQGLPPRVSALESGDRADHAAGAAVKELRRWLLGLAGLIVAAASVLAAVTH